MPRKRRESKRRQDVPPAVWAKLNGLPFDEPDPDDPEWWDWFFAEHPDESGFPGEPSLGEWAATLGIEGDF